MPPGIKSSRQQRVSPRKRARAARRRVAERGIAARRLLSSHQLQESLAVNAPLSVRIATIAGLQAALSVAIAVGIIYLSPWSHLVGFPALGALAALFGRYSSAGRRRGIVFMSAAMLTAAVLLPSLASFAGLPATGMMILLAIMAGILTIAVTYFRLDGPGAVIFLFAASAALSPLDSWGVIVERTVATAAGGTIAWLVCFLTDGLRTHDFPRPGTPAPRPFSHQLMAATRIALGAGISALLAYAAGSEHPAWAAIGATAVMQGAHLHITMSRALQRMAGTVVGAFIVWAILSAEPSFWTILAAIALFQFITEIIIGFNYALGQITITPMALLMTHLVSPASPGNMAAERVFDTILGAALGIVLALIFSTVDDRVYLARHQREKKLDA